MIHHPIFSMLAEGQSPINLIISSVPFVVDGSELKFGFVDKIFEVGGSHDGNLPLHFGSEDDVLDEVGDAVDGGLKIIDGGWLRFFKDLERLCDSEVHRFSTKERALHHFVGLRYELVVERGVAVILFFFAF